MALSKLYVATCKLPANKYTLPTQIKTTKFNMPMVEYMCLIQPITKIWVIIPIVIKVDLVAWVSDLVFALH